MIPQYSWCCDGMRVRAPTDAASEKARDRGEAKRQYAAQQMDLPSRTDASNRKHFLCRPAAPLQAPTRRVSKATNGVTPGPLHSRRRVVQGVQPPTLRHQRHPRTALPSPPRPWHQHEADPGAQKTEIRPKLQLFCETDRRNGAVLAKDACAFNANQAEQQHGTTGHRPCKHSCPHPWQKSRASSTEKCNI